MNLREITLKLASHNKFILCMYEAVGSSQVTPYVKARDTKKWNNIITWQRMEYVKSNISRRELLKKDG